MLLPTVSRPLTRFKLTIHAFKDHHKCTDELNAHIAHSDAAFDNKAASEDHQIAYERYVKLLRETPQEHHSQNLVCQKGIIRHKKMMDHHDTQNKHHDRMAQQHKSNSELCIGNRCKDAPASQKAAMKSAKIAAKSSSHAKLAVEALDRAKPLLGSKSNWRMGKAYLGDALRHTRQANCEPSLPEKMVAKVFHN